MARMQRNRESAMLSRQRKKMQLDELDRQNKQLQATNTHLSGVPSLSVLNVKDWLTWLMKAPVGGAIYAIVHFMAKSSSEDMPAIEAEH